MLLQATFAQTAKVGKGLRGSVEKSRNSREVYRKVAAFSDGSADAKICLCHQSGNKTIQSSRLQTPEFLILLV